MIKAVLNKLRDVSRDGVNPGVPIQNIGQRTYPDVYPDAIAFPHQPFKTRGRYRYGFPEGAVVHYTAGANLEGAVKTAVENGYAYMIIDTDGRVYQYHPLSSWGSHAGPSEWGAIKGVSPHFVGIEVVCPGIVTPVDVRALPEKTRQQLGSYSTVYKTWFGQLIHPETVRDASSFIGVRGWSGTPVGSYVKFTDAQEDALMKLLVWLCHEGIGVFDVRNIVGHYEVSPGRKVDPGASLSMTMTALRSAIQSKL